ncbi:MBL fold metallo-hydrolase [Moheibacter sp. BDHS18]|uniref:MBL fold metallo-hydrolase n=2 Tax=Moheibacter lacus TaxID=2745851 RepID=A0A838ZSW6_9FLAO|nr:MBL fold metallo-hydrolase [Moheibacter lacus]
MLIGFFIFLLLILVGVWGYMQHPKFGKAPSGERLERIRQSKNYKDGAFQNLNHTPQLAEGYTMMGVLWDFLTTTYPNTHPLDSIPAVKTDLKNLDPNENLLIWMGHSSYFIQLNGIKYLIDPVLSGNASPLPTTKAFPGSDVYKVADIPKIDFLLISHDHYDHLDYETIKSLTPKVGKVITGLGVGSHLEHWGYKSEMITEMDWNETTVLKDSTKIHTTPARHFAGRTLKRNNTLWLSFVLETPTKKLFLGGDSGYDTHFKENGEKHGPFDFALLEDGQYDPKWKYIHLLPEEVVKAAQELKTKRLMPVHNSKFKLGNHSWFDPLDRVTAEAEKQGMPILTPKIGEKVNLDNENQLFEKWWEGLK